MRQDVYIKFAEALQARALEKQAYDAADAIMAKCAEAVLEKDAGLGSAVRNTLAGIMLMASPMAHGAGAAAHALPKAEPAITQIVSGLKATAPKAKATIQAAKPQTTSAINAATAATKEPIANMWGNGPKPKPTVNWKRVLELLGIAGGSAAAGAGAHHVLTKDND